jgi:hypothetical protein
MSQKVEKNSRDYLHFKEWVGTLYHPSAMFDLMFVELLFFFIFYTK